MKLLCISIELIKILQQIGFSLIDFITIISKTYKCNDEVSNKNKY